MAYSKSLRILVADDTPDVRNAVRALLGREGMNVLEAEDGERALQICRTVPLDLILVDVHAPKLDGIELVSALREDELPRLRIVPVVLLATDARPALAARARAAGVTELLQKPLSPLGLAALLDRMQRRRISGSGAHWTPVRNVIAEESVASSVDRTILKRGA